MPVLLPPAEAPEEPHLYPGVVIRRPGARPGVVGTPCSFLPPGGAHWETGAPTLHTPVGSSPHLGISRVRVEIHGLLTGTREARTLLCPSLLEWNHKKPAEHDIKYSDFLKRHLLYEELGRSGTQCMPVAANPETTEMLELSDEDFKVDFNKWV